VATNLIAAYAAHLDPSQGRLASTIAEEQVADVTASERAAFDRR
jgi:hypothetical protein